MSSIWLCSACMQLLKCSDERFCFQPCKHCSFNRAQDYTWPNRSIIVAADFASNGLYNFIVPLRSHARPKSSLSPIVLLLEKRLDYLTELSNVNCHIKILWKVAGQTCSIAVCGISCRVYGPSWGSLGLGYPSWGLGRVRIRVCFVTSESSRFNLVEPECLYTTHRFSTHPNTTSVPVAVLSLKGKARSIRLNMPFSRKPVKSMKVTQWIKKDYCKTPGMLCPFNQCHKFTI